MSGILFFIFASCEPLNATYKYQVCDVFPKWILKASNILFTGNQTKKVPFRGNCTPNQKLACFVLYLKNFSTYASYSKLFNELNNGIENLVGPADFKSWIEIVNILFRSITQEPLDLLKLNVCLFVCLLGGVFVCLFICLFFYFLFFFFNFSFIFYFLSFLDNLL